MLLFENALAISGVPISNEGPKAYRNRGNKIDGDKPDFLMI